MFVTCSKCEFNRSLLFVACYCSLHANGTLGLPLDSILSFALKEHAGSDRTLLCKFRNSSQVRNGETFGV